MVGRTYASAGKEVDNPSAIARREVKKCDIWKEQRLSYNGDGATQSTDF
jgi:hypothetical protein